MVKKFLNKYRNMSDVAKATFWFFVCNIIQKCLSFITTPIFTRMLPTNEFGVVSTFNSWLAIVTIFVTLRLDYGIFNKGMSQFPKNRDEYTATMQGISTTICTIGLVVYILFHDFINEITGLSFSVSIIMFVELYASSAIAFWSLRQRYEYRYKSVIAVSLSLSAMHTIMGVLAILIFGKTGEVRIYEGATVTFLFGVVIYVINLKKGKVFINKEFAKYAILFNIPLLPHYFASFILDQFDRIMIMKMVDYSAVAIYSVAYSSGFVIKIVTNSLNSTLIPWQYRQLESKNFEGLRNCYNSILRTVFLCFALYMAVGPEIIRVMGSKVYVEANYVLPPITASVFLIFIYELFGNIEFYYNRNKFTMIIAIIGALINIVLNYIFIGLFGYIMAAYTTLACYLYFCIAHYLYSSLIVKKETNDVLFEFSLVAKYIVGICVYTAMISYMYKFQLIRYIWCILLLVYMVIKRKKLLLFMKILK